MATIEERLARLEDEREILRTLYDYGHALDYDYEDQFLDCWTAEAELHWPMASFRGLDELRETFRNHTHAPETYHKHFLMEPRIVLQGDTARVESMFARADAFPEGPQIRAFGRYLDVLVRCPDGRWRIKERRAEVEALRTS